MTVIVPREERLDDPPLKAVRATVEAIFDYPVVDVTRIEAGVNALYRIEFRDWRPVVLKAPTIATDQEFLVEPALLSRIGRETPVPVPQVYAQGRSEEGHLDVAFYAMELIDGRQILSPLDMPPPTRDRLVREAGAHLAAIHDIQINHPFGRLYADGGVLNVKSPYPSWEAFFEVLIEEVTAGLLGDGLLTDAEPRFADLEPMIRETLSECRSEIGSASPTPAVVIGDYRPANLILTREGNSGRLVQGVIDVGGLVGDPLLDAAMTEDALIDTPLGGMDSAENLRVAFRTAYADGRGAKMECLFDERYACYRLYARAQRLAAFDYLSQFARGTDPDSIAQRWRSFVATRMTEIRE